MRNRLLLFMLIFMGSFLIAQEDSLKLSMDELGTDDFSSKVKNQKNMVTAISRSTRNSNELPFTIYVITKKEIEERHYQTITDALKDLPGVKVSQPGNAMNGETFLLRGQFGNYYTKILIDNVPIQPSAVNGMPINAQIPIKNIDRIEVVLGTAADLYGADAMAGVINIVTRTSKKMKWGYADFEFGYPYYMHINFSIGGKTSIGKRVYEYSIYGGALERNDKNIVNGFESTYNPSSYSLGDTSFLNSPYYEGSATMPSIHKLGDQSIHGGMRLKGKHLMFGVDYMSRKEHSAIGQNPLYRTYHDPNNFFGETIIRVFGKYVRSFGKWTSISNLSFLDYKMDPNSSYKTVDNPQRVEGEFYTYAASNDIFFEQLFDYTFDRHFNILFGATYQFSGNFPTFSYFDAPFDASSYRPFSTSLTEDLSGLESIGFSPYNFYNASGLFQGFYDKNNWQVVVGFRADYHSQFGASFNPKIGVLYRLNSSMNLRASYGTAFRPPTSQHIFGGYVRYPSYSVPTSNFNLEPETNHSGEIGWRWTIDKAQSFDVHFFYVETNNHMSKTSTTDGTTSYYGYLNDSDSKNQLIGLVLAHNVTGIRLGSSKGFSHSSLQLSQGNEHLPFNRGKLDQYKELPQLILKWQFGMTMWENWGLSFKNTLMSSWLSASTNLALLQGTFKSDGFYNLDILLDYKVNSNTSVFFAVQNVTNAAYGGIGASGGFGLFNDKLILEDLFINPQKRTNWRLGAQINF